jgi:hypothetical protein
LIVGEVRADRLQEYVRLTEEKIRRKLRVMVVGMEEFADSKQTFLQRPHWKVV